MQFPILSVIVFTPIVTGLLILLIPAERKNEVRVAALAAGAVYAGESDPYRRKPEDEDEDEGAELEEPGE